MTIPSGERPVQRRLVLTPHPLQRVGAFALAALAGERDPEELGPEGFERAVSELVGYAVQASVRESKALDGFWQKVSLSFFPNSPMNHPGRRKGKTEDGRPKTDEDVREAVRVWLRAPDEAASTGVDCALCGRGAAGFYGKRDVVLAESEAYRNTTPRGHEGMAMCWPCLASFYALPYGCQLTGGSSVALHSWNDAFLAQVVGRQVTRNRRLAVTGDESKKQAESRELVAVRALRAYSERFTAGVELLVFNNNNNRGQLLESYSLSQPLAEWLRRTSRLADLRRAFTLLVRAHVTANVPGMVGLARNAFREPTRIISTGVHGLMTLMAAPDPDLAAAAEVAGLLVTFATEVMQVNEKDLAEIRATGHKIAGLWSEESSRGPLKDLRRQLRSPRQLRSWLTKQSVAWAGAQGTAGRGPLISERAYVLLFDPGADNPAWLHRDLLLITVLEELARLGWRADDEEQLEEVLAELDAADRKFISEDEEEGQ
ncbi:hypothetical protein [Streptomyces halobius]|uniref:CRISPR-associated protein Cst1 n=1 Tax=Streptomyces halobius TaxID=2879846 RepID=A0ABY4LZV7_9ACTN|nr:hypothetical protein [Streptomyces halobius]UQA90757.1 hypothetical protein K9S39_01625 [Streptomyces halobius]